jgi:hypothetical protein
LTYRGDLLFIFLGVPKLTFYLPNMGLDPQNVGFLHDGDLVIAGSTGVLLKSARVVVLLNHLFYPYYYN